MIGGGNVAYDVARTVLRQIAYDTARTAARRFIETHLLKIAEPVSARLEQSGIRYLALAGQALKRLALSAKGGAGSAGVPA